MGNYSEIPNGCSLSVISRLCLGHRSVEAWMLHQGGRGYPVHRFPIVMRLRDRKGRAILCIALNPHYGDSSGAILGVRSVALLHGCESVKRVVSGGRNYFVPLKIPFSLSSLLIRLPESRRWVPKSRLQ